ncbi:DUF5615 family PIN-like protein [Salinirussus salinus]|uniref:DUF5615 family PIN-like protein n=1 Tax=Salinirussus salinus TaxID=1198300 RepID=UPI00135B99E4|nr:DUF5615 family PIN-like protein [Salinirussus salinus]
MRILADANVPAEYVAALRGDGHEVRYSRDVAAIGPEAPDDTLVEFAETEDFAILSTDVKDFAEVDATAPVFVAPQGMTGGAVRTAVARIEAMEFDPAETEPLWLSSL